MALGTALGGITIGCGSDDDDAAGESHESAAVSIESSPATTVAGAATTEAAASSTVTSAAASTAAAGSSTVAVGVTVTINTFNFQPDPLTVAGTVITFVNEDAIDHTVTAGTRDDPNPELFDGVLPEKGATFELTLDEPGTYDYFCARHDGPGMTGTIVVE